MPGRTVVLVPFSRSCSATAWQTGFWAGCLTSALSTAPGNMISITRPALIILSFTCMLPSWQHWQEVKKFFAICLCNFNFFPTFSIWFCKSQMLWVFILTDLLCFSLEDYEFLAVIRKINLLVLTLVNFILTTLCLSLPYASCKMLSYSKHLYRSFSSHNSQISSKRTSWFKCTDRRTPEVEICTI